MATAAPDAIDPYVEWLNHAQPVGLVIAPKVLRDLGLSPEPQTRADSEAAAEAIARREGESAIERAWRICQEILDWPASRCPGAPGGPAGDELPSMLLPEMNLRIEPTWAVRSGSGDSTSPEYRLLVRVEDFGIDPDKRGALDGWEATAHQRFLRLLQDQDIPTGVLITEDQIRLIHAPRGETAGWISFPLEALGQVAGRPMLGGLKLLLHRHRLLNAAPSQQLPALLRMSREAQAEVSAKLSGQILGALHELLRGLDKADPGLIRGLAAERPQHLYEGVLAVLMRLVFVLYAEDRDLMPTAKDGEARAIYDNGYSVRGLFDRLLEDDALNPGTMDERFGGWGRLLALFRIIHSGHSRWIKRRGGKLFDPNEFPFLEGRTEREDMPRVLPVSDGCLLRILSGLMMLGGERLSYRTLDVEQIGSVYETIIGFTIKPADTPMIAVTGGKHGDAPVFVELPALLSIDSKKRATWLQDLTDRKLTAKQSAPVREAGTVEALVAALGPVIDNRASPDHVPAAVGAPVMQPTEERRRTGSHYTPRSLTSPILDKTLTPILAGLGEHPRAAQLLELKLCDPAMGSGAFLVEACRALARHVVLAWADHPEDRPTIPEDEDEELHARRLVAQRCLYGVDRNPMAVDLARLSLWLVTLAADHEFTFLDHALKVGDSLVGLTREQITALTWMEARAGLPLVRALVDQRFNAVIAGREAIREAPDDVERAEQEGRFRQVEQQLDTVRLLGDALVGTFFTGENAKARKRELEELEQAITGRGHPPRWEVAQLYRHSVQAQPHPIVPLHWEIEFPEVFGRPNPGFDGIIGNPPFAGKNTIADGHRQGYGDWLKAAHSGSHGNADICAHFFRRAFSLLRQTGVFGLIATNTIAQGDTRATGLRMILGEGGTIISATRRMKWPGAAAVVVSIVHVMKGDPPFGLQVTLDGTTEERISAYLVRGYYDETPQSLTANRDQAFQGAIVLGMGFTFDDSDAKGVASPISEMERLIAEEARNSEIIRPYLGGEEVNNHPEHKHHRYVIDFGEMPLRRDEDLVGWATADEDERLAWLREGVVPRDYPDPVAQDWPSLLAIVEAKVKPERDKDNREARRKRWWQFGDRQPGLQRLLKSNRIPYALSRVSPMLMIGQIDRDTVMAETIVVFGFDSFWQFLVIQSRIHEIWARFFSSTLEERLRYAPSDCFETFPFPHDEEAVMEDVGRRYHELRAGLMRKTSKGLTKIYNSFNNPKENNPDILLLRQLHAEMDAAVLCAYGWADLADRACPEFLQKDDATEHPYGGKLFWPADFRDEVLKRLIDLNRQRAAEEANAPQRGARRA